MVIKGKDWERFGGESETYIRWDCVEITVNVGNSVSFHVEFFSILFIYFFFNLKEFFF